VSAPIYPPWAFWRPLSFWKVLLIFFVSQLAAHLFVVLLREGLRLQVPIAAAGGVGGFLGWLIVNSMVRKARS
jgi:hypothetical protein